MLTFFTSCFWHVCDPSTLYLYKTICPSCHLQCVTHQHRFEYTQALNILFLLVHHSCMTLDTIKSTFLRNWNSKYFACLSKVWVILTVNNSSCMSHSCFLQQFWLFAAAVCHLCFFYSLMHAAAPWCEAGFGVLKSAGVSDMPAWVVTDGGFFSSTQRGFKRLLQKWSTTWQGSSSFISDRTSMRIWILDKWPISCLWNNRWWEMKDAFPFWLKALKLNKRN